MTLQKQRQLNLLKELNSFISLLPQLTQANLDLLEVYSSQMCH